MGKIVILKQTDAGNARGSSPNARGSILHRDSSERQHDDLTLARLAQRVKTRWTDLRSVTLSEDGGENCEISAV